MKLVRVGEPGAERPGVLDDEGGVRDLSALVTDIDGDLLADPGRLAAVRAALEVCELPAWGGSRRFGPPVARPGKVVGIGLNYHDHAEAAGVEPPAEPIVFLKPSSSITGPYDLIVVPDGSEHTDWEVELGVVIGSPLRACDDPGAAMGAIAGYAAVNDVTERAHVQQGPTWAKGKCHDTFCPLGPWLVTADEIPDPQALRLELRVNGTPRQRGSSANMVFGVGELLAHLQRADDPGTGRSRPHRHTGWCGGRASRTSPVPPRRGRGRNRGAEPRPSADSGGAGHGSGLGSAGRNRDSGPSTLNNEEGEPARGGWRFWSWGGQPRAPLWSRRRARTSFIAISCAPGAWRARGAPHEVIASVTMSDHHFG